MEKDLNRKIYDVLIEYAHTVFPCLDMKVEGTFTTAQLAQNWVMDEKKKCKTPIYDCSSSKINAEPVTFTIDTFRMTFVPSDVFRIAWKFESLAGIKQAEKERFTNVEEGRALIKFDLPKEARRIVNACAKDDLRTQMGGVYVDVEQRCIVASDGLILKAISIPDMEVAPEATSTIIHPKVVKNATDTIIVTDKYATNGKDKEKNIEGRYPQWKSVLPPCGENQKIDLKGLWEEIRKAVKSCKKISWSHDIYMKGTEGESTLIISAKDEFGTEKCTSVKLKAPLPCGFKILFCADYLLNVKTADSLYLHSASKPVVFVSEKQFSLVMPKYLKEDVWLNIDPINPRSPLDICGFTPAPSAAPALPHIATEPTHLLPPPQVMLFSHLFVFVWDTSEAQSEAA